jgi:hypothetical protein
MVAGQLYRKPARNAGCTDDLHLVFYTLGYDEKIMLIWYLRNTHMKWFGTA